MAQAHARGERHRQRNANAATYRLKPRATEFLADQLTQAAYFFWSSGSAFRYALAAYPTLRERTHFCGPGATQRTIEAVGIQPHICLDHESWLAEMS